MSEYEPESVLGPGGLVRDERLLKEINATKPLPSSDILKLGRFYKGYETNRVLGDHLTLVALTQIIGDPGLKQEIGQTVARSSMAGGITDFTYQDLLDLIEDSDGAQEGGEKNDDAFGASQVRFLPLSHGLGLLIETPPHKKGSHPRHYVIGASPNPNSLPK